MSDNGHSGRKLLSRDDEAEHRANMAGPVFARLLDGMRPMVFDREARRLKSVAR